VSVQSAGSAHLLLSSLLHRLPGTAQGESCACLRDRQNTAHDPRTQVLICLRCAPLGAGRRPDLQHGRNRDMSPGGHSRVLGTPGLPGCTADSGTSVAPPRGPSRPGGQEVSNKPRATAQHDGKGHEILQHHDSHPPSQQRGHPVSQESARIGQQRKVTERENGPPPGPGLPVDHGQSSRAL